MIPFSQLLLHLNVAVHFISLHVIFDFDSILVSNIQRLTTDPISSAKNYTPQKSHSTSLPLMSIPSSQPLLQKKALGFPRIEPFTSNLSPLPQLESLNLQKEGRYVVTPVANTPTKTPSSKLDEFHSPIGMFKPRKLGLCGWLRTLPSLASHSPPLQLAQRSNRWLHGCTHKSLACSRITSCHVVARRKDLYHIAKSDDRAIGHGSFRLSDIDNAGSPSGSHRAYTPN